MDRQRIQSPEQPPLPASTTPSGDKVCIGFSCLGRDSYGNTYSHYKLCVVDLNSDVVVSGDDNDDGDGFAPIYPTLQIDAGISATSREPAFCVRNQTLYVFEDCRTRHNKFLPNQKSIFTFDLRSLFDSTAQSNLTKIGNMIYPKVGPSAVPTPDGKKILLLSTHLEDNTIRNFRRCVFELFDPETESSEPLPSIPDLIDRRDIHFLILNLHGFISKSKFAVRTPWIGNYVIDLEGERIWERLPESFCKGLHLSRQVVFLAVGDRFLFTPDDVQDMNYNDDVKIKRYRTSSSFSAESIMVYNRVSNLTLLKHDEDKGEFYFCVLDSDCSRKLYFEDMICNFSIDVCRAVYPRKGGEEEEKPLEVEVKSSRALKLSGEPGDQILSPCFLVRI